MRVMILGSAGMLGHKLYQQFQHRFDTWATVRSSFGQYSRFKLFNPERLCGGIDAFRFETVDRILRTVQPDVVINCIGIVKQIKEAKDPIPSIKINALFPHQVAKVTQELGIRMIHISTDCVFNGRRGMYTEGDPSDAEDLYGRSKFLGEVDYPHTLTLRTSIIGREMMSDNGLVDWFLSNRPNGTVRGYKQAIYTGFTTIALSEIIGMIITAFPELSGVYQVSSEPINKYELLLRLRDAYDTNIQVEPDDAVQIDRSLDSTRFQQATGFTPPTWKRMVEQMAADLTPYDKWKELNS